MTGPHFDSQNDSQNQNTRPISVAELLAKNDMIGSPPISGRRRRRRGNADAVTVAELTGEIPVVSDDDPHAKSSHQATHSRRSNGGVRHGEPVSALPGSEEPLDPVAEEVPAERSQTGYWSEPEPRWPESPPPSSAEPPRSGRFPRAGATGVERIGDGAQQSGAEEMSPDPLVDYADIPVDVMDTEVREAQPATEDSAYVRSYLDAPAGRLVGGKAMTGDPHGAESAVGADLDDVDVGVDATGPDDNGDAWPSRTQTLLHGGLVVLQSVLAVMLGAGLFVAFDQLWRWNNIVALVLSVVVILGLVVAVRVVRKTEDIVSTLIAVAVGALVTLGPLALLQSA
ncbi:MAG: hypothetical protein QJR12_00555 [Mycobacterium sp.]|uniref:hypothetical protein n=1 Tax=Mycobacterium sp. TaxID=1785 RepID=UPI002637F4AF|nr:hypothetical protein [Mycobacterium sp.]MDI3312813.1 hypothetical protein [Mycobacterium sp.]